MMLRSPRNTSSLAVLLAGGPGSGKSTISQALRDQGFRSIDLDFGYARWEDLDGSPVQFPDEPGWSWLRSHRWRWRSDLLDAAITDVVDQPVVFAGTASNMFDLLDRFDLRLLLQMDDQTRQRRLADPSRNNTFGRVGDTAAWSSWWHRTVESEMLKRGAVAVDANRALDDVVASVCEQISRKPCESSVRCGPSAQSSGNSTIARSGSGSCATCRAGVKLGSCGGARTDIACGRLWSDG